MDTFLFLLGICLGVEFLGHMVTLCLTFLRNFQKVHRSCDILHFDQQCMRIPISLHPCQHLLLFVFLITAKLVSMKEYCIVVLLSISLMTNDVEDPFMCLLAICVFSLKKCLFKSFTYVFLGYLSFYC